MFRKSKKAEQLNLFASPVALLAGKSQTFYQDTKAWHNLFRNQVTMRINESIFQPLFCKDNGSPNASIRVMIAMMVLKEAEGLSDQKLFENCQFNILFRSALGLHNTDDPIPAESTYYLFRKRINDYAKQHDENLFSTAFAQITKEQCLAFSVSGKRIRMDSKLMGSNIAWLGRYELIHETLRIFYRQINTSPILDKADKARLDELLKLEGNKVVYTCSSEEVQSRLQELGILIYKILPLFSSLSSTSEAYQTLQQVFNQQYQVDEEKLVTPLEKEKRSAQSIQSPHDTDCHYRDKDGQKVKGYSMNVTESCDDDGDDKPSLNLIAHVDVKNVSTSDVAFFQDNVQKAQEVVPQKIETVHTDGAYHSPENQEFCKKNVIRLHLNAIQGTKGRFQFSYSENGDLIIFDPVDNKNVDYQVIIGKDGVRKWRIKTTKWFRYLFQKDIDNYLIRKEIEETPIETLQYRNNVEATIFQLGFHYPNAKSRYRGMIKHQMWANIRCLWVNFVRIWKYTEQLCQRTSLSGKIVLSEGVAEAFFAFITFFKELLRPIPLATQNIRLSASWGN